MDTVKDTRENYKTVKFTYQTDKKFENVAQKLGRSKQELFAQMVDYFYKSKKDPTDLNDEALKKDLSAGISRVLSFLKIQERDFFTPTIVHLEDNKKFVKEFRDRYAASWNKAFGNDATNSMYKIIERMTNILNKPIISLKGQTELIQNDTKMIREDIAKLLSHLQRKEEEKLNLKTQFSSIMELYIEERERFGITTTKETKLQLIEQTRLRLKNL